MDSSVANTLLLASNASAAASKAGCFILVNHSSSVPENPLATAISYADSP